MNAGIRRILGGKDLKNLDVGFPFVSTLVDRVLEWKGRIQ